MGVGGGVGAEGEEWDGTVYVGRSARMVIREGLAGIASGAMYVCTS